MEIVLKDEPKKKKTRTYSLEKLESRAGLMFATPAIIGFLLFILIPMICVFFLSMFKVDLISNTFEFKQLTYYDNMIHDKDFWKSVRNSLVYMIIYVPLTLAMGLRMALILNTKMRARGVVRTFFIIPYITTYVATLVVWNVFLHPTEGPVNSLLMSLGISNPPQYMVNVNWALPILAIIGSWKDVGYHCILFLAALQGVSKDYYEASSIDGATLLQRFKHITFPLISPTTFFLLLITIIGGLQAFYQMAILTKGGPAFSTTTMTYHIYRSAFEYYNFSYASAVGMFMFLLTLVFIMINWFAQKKWVFYQ
ncbi:carbohydrate ABC transporter permease [Paenibacillus yanchengensis]|uniref:Carbohydrate ABC transporter permease n=1 Tax=Paenibacillus yanchengensis TaxID=2035833 RepID=A0ABW4YFB2_9BACL